VLPVAGWQSGKKACRLSCDAETSSQSSGYVVSYDVHDHVAQHLCLAPDAAAHDELLFIMACCVGTLDEPNDLKYVSSIRLAPQMSNYFSCGNKHGAHEWRPTCNPVDLHCQVFEHQHVSSASSSASLAPQTLSTSLLGSREGADEPHTCGSLQSFKIGDGRSYQTQHDSVERVPSEQSANGFSMLFNDRISVQGSSKALASEVWLFFNAVSSQHGVRRFAGVYETVCLGLIGLNTVLAMINSIEGLGFLEGTMGFRALVSVTCCMFTIEYLCRLWSCVEVREYYLLGPLWGRLRYATKLLPLLDLLVVLSMCTDIMLLEMTLSRGFGDLQAFRLVRMLRVLSVLKVERKTNSLNLVFKVLARKKSELYAALSVASTLMVISGSLMYYLENQEQPETFASIPASMWWAVTALTTVGYGDMVPITPAGQFVAAIVSIFGVGLFALPAGILGSGFVDVLHSSLIAECASKEQNILDEVGEENRKIDALIQDMWVLRTLVHKMQEDQHKVLAALSQMSDCNCASGSQTTAEQVRATASLDKLACMQQPVPQ